MKKIIIASSLLAISATASNAETVVPILDPVVAAIDEKSAEFIKDSMRSMMESMGCCRVLPERIPFFDSDGNQIGEVFFPTEPSGLSSPDKFQSIEQPFCCFIVENSK